MSDTLLLVDASRAVEFIPPIRPSSATLVFRDPSGNSLSTPTVTVDALSRTVTVASTAQPAQVATAATGTTGTPTVGWPYWWTSVDDGAHESLVVLSEFDATVWTLETPVPGATAIQVGDLFRGARCTATIPASATATKDANYTLEWTIVGADGLTYVYQDAAHVCRTLYRVAVSVAEARAFVTDAFPSHADTRSYGYFRRLAERASERVWRRLKRGGHLLQLVKSSGSSSIFQGAGEVAVRIELLREFIVPPGAMDITQYRSQLDTELDREIEDAMTGVVYDADDDGAVDVGDEISSWSIPLRRR